MILKYIRDLSWGVVIIVCLTLGLAPFNPPHLVEKLIMLSNAELQAPLDWFDLLLHGSPWVLLIAKVVLLLLDRSKSSQGKQ